MLPPSQQFTVTGRELDCTTGTIVANQTLFRSYSSSAFYRQGCTFSGEGTFLAGGGHVHLESESFSLQTIDSTGVFWVGETFDATSVNTVSVRSSYAKFFTDAPLSFESVSVEGTADLYFTGPTTISSLRLESDGSLSVQDEVTIVDSFDVKRGTIYGKAVDGTPTRVVSQAPLSVTDTSSFRTIDLVLEAGGEVVRTALSLYDRATLTVQPDTNFNILMLDQSFSSHSSGDGSSIQVFGNLTFTPTFLSSSLNVYMPIYVQPSGVVDVAGGTVYLVRRLSRETYV